MSYIPVDTTAPVIKEIVITKPTGADTWKKGDTAIITFTTKAVNSVWVYFSQDSGKTYTTLFGSTQPVVSELKYLPTTDFTGTYGKLIVKDAISSTADTSDYFTLDNGVGLQEKLGGIGVLVYPNPSRQNFTVESTSKILQIELYDFNGKLLIQQEENKVDISKLPQGVYSLKIITNSGVIVKKMIKEE